MGRKLFCAIIDAFLCQKLFFVENYFFVENILSKIFCRKLFLCRKITTLSKIIALSKVFSVSKIIFLSTTFCAAIFVASTIYLFILSIPSISVTNHFSASIFVKKSFSVKNHLLSKNPNLCTYQSADWHKICFPSRQIHWASYNEKAATLPSQIKRPTPYIGISRVSTHISKTCQQFPYFSFRKKNRFFLLKF